MDDCPRAPKRRTDAPQQSAGGANRTFAHTPQSTAWMPRNRVREGQTGRLPTRPRARHGCRAKEGGRGKPLPYKI